MLLCRLCCVGLCFDLLFVVSSGYVALHCIVLQSAVCCVDQLCCVALRCTVVMHYICFSSLSLRCVVPVVLLFHSCLLLLLVFLCSPLN